MFLITSKVTNMLNSNGLRLIALFYKLKISIKELLKNISILSKNRIIIINLK